MDYKDKVFRSAYLNFQRLSLYRDSWGSSRYLVFERLIAEADRKNSLQFEMPYQFFVQDLNIKLYSVRKEIRYLKESGFISIFRVGTKSPNVYLLHVDWMIKNIDHIFKVDEAKMRGIDHIIEYFQKYMGELKKLHEKSLFHNGYGRFTQQKHKKKESHV